MNGHVLNDLQRVLGNQAGRMTSLHSAMNQHHGTYAERAAKQTNAAAIHLLDIIERKHSNLCVSVDVTVTQEFLQIIDTVGPYVCLIKARVFFP